MSSGCSKLSETLPTRRRPHPTFSGANHSARPSTTPAALGAAPLPRPHACLCKPHAQAWCIQAHKAITTSETRACGRYPNGLLLFAGVPPPNTERCWLFPLRLPHPVASHARLRMMLQSTANTLPTPPPRPPWIFSPGKHSIRRHLQAVSRGLRQYTQDSSCSAPRYCNHEPIRSPHLEGYESVEGSLTTGTWAGRRGLCVYLMRPVHLFGDHQPWRDCPRDGTRQFPERSV